MFSIKEKLLQVVFHYLVLALLIASRLASHVV